MRTRGDSIRRAGVHWGSRLLSALLVWAFLSAETQAQMRDPLGINKDQQVVGGTSEFMFRNDPEELLVPVYVLGAVAKPGLYHIPIRTDLITLMAITGGPAQTADLEEVTIKRGGGKDVSVVNLEKLVSTKEDKSPLLGNNDVVLVKNKEPIVSNNTVLLVTVIGGVISIALSAFALQKAFGNK